jgi:hypothetical protein
MTESMLSFFDEDEHADSPTATSDAPEASDTTAATTEAANTAAAAQIARAEQTARVLAWMESSRPAKAAVQSAAVFTAPRILQTRAQQASRAVQAERTVQAARAPQESRIRPETPEQTRPRLSPNLSPDHHLRRIVADSTDRVAWLRARSQGITATDVAKLATPKSVQNAAHDKMHGTGFTGNTFTDHGRAREPEIAEWVRNNYGIEPSSNLFHAATETRHLATPDGLALTSGGSLELAEIKTTSKPWRSIPRNYLRQVWWQQYVLGADRTLLVWEQHRDFVPVNAVPECQWIERDEDQIAILVGFANDLIDILNRQRDRENQNLPAYRDEPPQRDYPPDI